MILIVNLNLAVDHIVEVDDLRAGEVQRSRGARSMAGGKGVNVARVLKTLGERSLLLGFAGGRAGDLIESGLRAEQLASRCTRVREESRTCLIINDRRRCEQTVINAPGAAVAEAEWRDFEAAYTRELPGANLVVINGSLPPNLHADTYARLAMAARDAGRRVLLDCAGAPLRHALAARPFLVKINAAEAAEFEATEFQATPLEPAGLEATEIKWTKLSDMPIAEHSDVPVAKLSGVGLPATNFSDADFSVAHPSGADFSGAARAARRLCEAGAENAMITLGAQGAMLDFAGVRYKFVAPRVRAVNSVGSGDAALAAFAAALRQGLTPQAAGALAVAAGAANALHGAGGCSADEIAELLPRVGCELGQ
ncbi:MAG: tagatose 6-phosphate kinase [Pyrinomonadaceae bacterium]|nr:tagatose 6-phosphate kinase [Pyrinomonadaceae bacterium]